MKDYTQFLLYLLVVFFSHDHLIVYLQPSVIKWTKPYTHCMALHWWLTPISLDPWKMSLTVATPVGSNNYLPQLWEFAGPRLCILSVPAAQVLTVWLSHPWKPQALGYEEATHFCFKIYQALFGNTCPTFDVIFIGTFLCPPTHK